MLFVKLDGCWYEKPVGGNKLYNYHGGWNVYKPLTNKFEQTIECEDWHELYLKTDFTIGQYKMFDAWLSPKGELFYCECHYTGAEEILEIVFGEDERKNFIVNGCIANADDRLEEKGFVKLTTSMMWDVRIGEWECKDLTRIQMDKVVDWCVEHNLRLPVFGGVE